MDSCTAPWLPRWGGLLTCLALLAIVALVYWPGLNGGYAFDDFPNIVNNQSLRVTSLRWDAWLAAAFSSPASDLQRPLAMLSFAANYYFTGLAPLPMKLTNVAIHAMNALLVFALVSQLVSSHRAAKGSPGASRAAAAFISAAWAANPINLMAVLFIVQRMESLSHTFVFLGLGLYVYGRRQQLTAQGSWVWIFAGLLPCTLLGLLAKESAVLLPLYAFCLELCLFHFVIDGRRDRRLFALYSLALLLPAMAALAWLLPRYLAPDAYLVRSFTLGERLLTEPRVVLDYLRWTLLPNLRELSLNHDDYQISRNLWTPVSTILSLLALLALLVVAWLARVRRPMFSLGLLWFFTAHLLTATFIPLELMFEHRNYFASLGICVALADLLLLAPASTKQRQIGAFFAVTFLVFFAGITFLRANEWSNPVRFISSEAAKHPQSARASYDLGRVLVVLSNYRAASPYTQEAIQALEKARQVRGGNILADQAALMLEARAGIPISDVWWQDMQALLRSKPLGPQPIAALGGITLCAIEEKCNFPRSQMLRTFEAALSRGPDAAVLHIYGDYVLNVENDPASALRIWREAAELRPQEVQFHRSLARLLIALGRYDEARAQIRLVGNLGRFGQNRALKRELEAMLLLRQSQTEAHPAN